MWRERRERLRRPANAASLFGARSMFQPPPSAAAPAPQPAPAPAPTPPTGKSTVELIAVAAPVIASVTTMITAMMSDRAAREERAAQQQHAGQGPGHGECLCATARSGLDPAHRAAATQTWLSLAGRPDSVGLQGCEQFGLDFDLRLVLLQQLLCCLSQHRRQTNLDFRVHRSVLAHLVLLRRQDQLESKRGRKQRRRRRLGVERCQ